MASPIDPRSGFCDSNSIFYSKRKPIPLPPNPFLDVTTFISSHSHNGKIAFIDAATGKHLTFSDLWQSVDAVASSLSDMGIKKGHVILLLSPNSIYFPVVCLSVMSLGAIITTTNPLNTDREIAKQIADSKPVLAFTTSQLALKIAAASNLPIIFMDSESPTKKPNIKIATTLDEMMREKPNKGRLKERIEQEDTATLLYSSGTTGASKGVVSSHRNLIAMVQTILSRFRLEKGEESTFICTVPMFHIYGLAAFATGLLTSGSTVVVLSKFEMHEMLSAIERYRASYLPLVPPILVALINGADKIRVKYDLSSLHTMLSGGAPLSKEVIEGFVDKYPAVTILQGYGLTESAGIGASTDSLEESRRYGTAGMLSPSMEAKIIDPESGKALAINQTGELWLRGPTIMKGYFSNEEATTSTLDSEGWLRTGDLCYMDEDGFIFVVDRLKELIKYKGYQVPPAELEALLLTHPEISDAAVIPFPDREVGQYPMAYVVRKAGSSLSEAAIMEFVTNLVIARLFTEAFDKGNMFSLAFYLCILQTKPFLGVCYFKTMSLTERRKMISSQSFYEIWDHLFIVLPYRSWLILYVYAGGPIQENSEGGVRTFNTQESIWQNSQEGSHQARNIETVKIMEITTRNSPEL